MSKIFHKASSRYVKVFREKLRSDSGNLCDLEGLTQFDLCIVPSTTYKETRDPTSEDFKIHM